MAKRHAAKKVDPLTVSLKLLALADVDSIRAVRSLGKALEDPLKLPGDSTRSRKAPSGPTKSAEDPVQLGCCVYEGGQTPNLTQAQCNNYDPISWDPHNPSCAPGIPE